MKNNPNLQLVSGMFGAIKRQSAGKLVSVSGIGKHGATLGGLVINQPINGETEMSLRTALAEKRQQISNLVAEVEAISTKCEKENRAETPAEKARLEAITSTGGLLDQLGEQVTSLDKKERIMDRAMLMASPRLEAQIAESEGRSIVTSNQTKSSVFASKQDAHDAGMFYAASVLGSRKAERYCESHGLISNSMTGGDDSKGGAVVPEVLERTIIELREQFGTFRQESQVIPMSSDSHVIPKVIGEVTSYYVSEMGAITASDMALTQIRLNAKKLATFTAVASELEDDAIIAVAEMLTRSIAYSFALKEDQAGFLGDGTTTYGGIMGLNNILAAGSVVTATGRTTFGALTLADFEGVVGKAKLWAGSKPKWYISQQGWANSMQRLLDAAGGNTLVSLAMGAEKTFLGFPVVISQVLPSALTGTTGTHACYFGDLKQGVYFGSRRGINVKVDPSFYFSQDALAVRATQRYDINIHDIGDATNAGGIVKLLFG